MKKSVFPSPHRVLLLSLLGLMGCYSTVGVDDSSANVDKLIAIDLVEPECAEPGSSAGYIEGNGFGAKNVTITIGGIEAEVLSATGMDASFIVPEGLEPGPVEIVVENPGGRIATINWVVCGPGPDTDPPEVSDVDFNPKTVDVTTQDQVVNCSVTATDPVGIELVSCSFESPTSGQSARDSCVFDPSSSSAGVFTCPVTVPQGAEAGTWTLVTVFVEDDIGNRWSATTADLQALGFPTDLTVTSSGGGDTDPPEVSDVDFNPKTVDVTTQDQVVNCSVTAMDPVGIELVSCSFESPTSGQSARDSCVFDPSSSSAGVFTCPVTVPQGAEAGTWTLVTVFVEDDIGNRWSATTADLQALGFPTDLTVTSSGGGDTDPPEVSDVDFNPKTVDVTTQDQVVNCSVTATDPVGIELVSCSFESPTSGQSARDSCVFDPSSSSAGVFTCPVTVPQGAEAGTWTLVTVFVEDDIGNRWSATTADLQALGFPTELEVTYGGGSPTP